MMKPITVALLSAFMLVNITASAQNNEKARSLANGYGGFGGLLYDVGPVLGATGLSQGGGGAFLWNNFFIGGYGMGLVTNHYKRVVYLNPDDKSGNPYDYSGDPVKFGHGGLLLGKVIPLKGDVSLMASGTFGWGGLAWSPNLGDKRRQKMYQIEENIFVMQPKLMATYQPLRWLRLEAGLGYRMVFTSNKQYLDISGPGAPRWRNFFESGEFSAPTFNFGIMFGAF
ncbi:MAG: hypothetical protein LWX09_02935 [Bacteroidia bacterium]|nr:hypothetical protein [Bacteroidia bacterium]